MRKEELEKEAEGWLNKWELCNKCENKVDCISNFSYCKKVVLQSYIASAEPREKRIAELVKENAELRADNEARKFAMAMSEKVEKQLREENTELKVKVGLSIDCEKAKKNGELCLGYGGDEDEPCEICKNCIKCEGGYYQLGETEKDEQLTTAKELLNMFLKLHYNPIVDEHTLFCKVEQFLNSEVEK